MTVFNPAALLEEGARPLIMGILNVTPDSFYPGSRTAGHDDAVERAFKMAEEGADIIDIGGESSRPGADPVSESQESDRVIPVIEALAGRLNIPVSVDTYHAGVARNAVQAGATIVNDISALGFDDDMAGLVAASHASVVLMHMQGEPRTMQANPQYDDVVEEVYGYLEDRIAYACSRGIDRSRIIIDPGIGFGKTLEHNLALLRGIERFHRLRCPVLVGASRKRMIAAVTGAEVDERAWGTAAIVSHGVLHGVQIHRVHDVKEMRQVCDMAFALRGE